MSSSQALTASSGQRSKLTLKHLTQWLQKAPEVWGDGESPPWLLNQPWMRHGLDLILFLAVFWVVSQSSLTTSFVLGLPMTMMGTAIGFRLLSTMPSLELLRSLPLRPKDIVRGQFLVASRRTVFSLIPLLLFLWAVYGSPFGGDGRDLHIRNVILAIIICFAALFFTLALGLSTHPSRGGLSAHRRRSILCQAVFLLYGHWTLESHLATTNGSLSLAFTPLNTSFLVALVVLCATTLRSQLRAGLALRDSPLWGEWSRQRDFLLFPVYVLSYVFLSAEDAIKFLLYGSILLLIAQSYQRKPGRRVAAHQKWLDAVSFLGLLAADIALWMQISTVPEALKIQLFVILFWFLMQSLGERVARRQTAEISDLASPSSTEEMDSSRPIQRSPKPVSRNRPNHLVRSAWSDFFRSSVLTGQSASFLFLASLAGLFLSPLLLLQTPLLGLFPLATLIIAGVIDRVRRTSIDHPLLSTLPVTRRELGQSLLASTRRLVLPILTVLFVMQLVVYQGTEATVQGASLGLVFLTYGFLLGVIWIFSVALSLPVPADSPSLSKGWKTMTILQILIAFLSLLTLHEMPQLSLVDQLMIHGVLWATLLWTIRFAWKTQRAAFSRDMGMDLRPSPSLKQAGTSLDPDWVLVPFLAIVLYLPENSFRGFGAFFSLLVLITLVLYQTKSVQEAKLESVLFKGFVFLFGFALWIVIQAIVWPVGSDLDVIQANLVLLVAWSTLGTWWETRRLKRIQKLHTLS